MLTPATSRGARLALVALSLLVLLAVVAVASRGGFGHSTHARPGSSAAYTSWAMSVLLVLMVAATPIAIYVFVVQQREGGLQPQRKSFVRRVLEPLVFCALVVLALAVRRRIYADLFGRAAHPPARRAVKHGLAHAAAGTHHGATAAAHFEWPVLWLALAAAVATAAVLAVRRRRQEAPRPEAESIDEELASTIRDAIDDLDAEPDPRRAVIAAYARMEGVLARHGLERRPSETPLEYLRAVLARLSGRGAAAGRLTALFEEARFSTHPVDASMKRDAIASLRSIRDGLLETA